MICMKVDVMLLDYGLATIKKKLGAAQKAVRRMCRPKRVKCRTLMPTETNGRPRTILSLRSLGRRFIKKIGRQIRIVV